ncbi:MAK10-like protein [Tanacetum coccineum]
MKTSWNTQETFAKPSRLSLVPQDVPRCPRYIRQSVSSSSEREIKSKRHNYGRAHLDAQTKPVQVKKIASSCEIYNGPHDTQYFMEDPERAFVKYASTRIVRNVEVHVGKLKLFEDFHVVDMEREPTFPLLVGRGFLATANVVIDCKKAKIAVGEGLTRTIFGVKELDFGDDNEPY